MVVPDEPEKEEPVEESKSGEKDTARKQVGSGRSPYRVLIKVLRTDGPSLPPASRAGREAERLRSDSATWQV